MGLVKVSLRTQGCQGECEPLQYPLNPKQERHGLSPGSDWGPASAFHFRQSHNVVPGLGGLGLRIKS